MAAKRFSEYRIFQYLKPYKWLAALTVIIGAASTAATGGIAYQAKTVIEALQEDPIIGEAAEIMKKAGISKEPIEDVRKRLKISAPAVRAVQHETIVRAMQEAGIPAGDIDLTTRSLQRVGTPDAKWHILLTVSYILGGLAIVIAVTEFGKIFLKRYIAYRIDYDLRNDLCRHLMGLSIGFFNRKRTGELLSNMTNDIGTANRALTLVFAVVNLPVELVSALVFSWLLDPYLAITMMVMMPIIALPTWKYRKKIRKASAGRLEKLADLTQDMSQLLTGIRTVKAFRMEDEEVEEFRRIGKGVLRKSMKATRAKGAGTAFTTFLSRFGAAAVTLGVGYVIIFHGPAIGLGLEDVMPFFGFTALAYKAIKTGAKDYSSLQEYLPASERLFKVFDVRPMIFDRPDAVGLDAVRQGISFRNVEFSYDTVPVLKNINFDVKAGSIVAIVGHSGAGKSTLLDLIPRFYDPQQGSVEIDGLDLRRVTRDSLLANIAIVGQQPFLFNITIAENIRYGRRNATLEEIIEAARAANIHDFIQSQPESYDTVVGEQGVRLSGGQRQRLTIARAILKDAPILILDEATSSLDNESEKLVQGALQNLMKSRTTFVIAHRLSTVQYADRIVVLKDGEIVEDGDHKTLLAADGEYAKLYQSEL